MPTLAHQARPRVPPFPDYPIPADEDQRLRDLRRHGLLDTATDPHVQRIVDLTGRVLAMPIALVSLVDRQRQWFLAARGLAARETPREMAFCAHTIGGDGVLMVPDALEDERFSGNPLVLGEPRIRFYAGAPLRSSSGHNLGTLCVIDQRPRLLSGEQLGLLQHLAELVMRELELRRRSSLCPVTGLYTRSSFFELGEQEFREARRRRLPLALLTLDIDDFRQINQRWGHEAGDQVLLDVCNLIRQRTRPQDLVGRIGDEEFAVLLPESNPQDALAFAEGLRAAVAAMPGVFSHSDYQPQVSGGLTSLSADDRCFADLFYRADQALYLAKGNGRNQIARLVLEEPDGDGQS